MKRKYSSVADCTRSKHPKLLPGLPPRTRNYFWVSATDTRNFMIKDPLVDWLKLTRKTSGTTGAKTTGDFFEFILEKGNEFEKRLVEYIHENRISVVSVGDRITNKTCRETIKLMKQGVPIIHSAPFKNGRHHMRGIIDLLVRSDHIGSLVGDNPLPEHLHNYKAPKLNGNYHYVVVDVKFSTLPLRADGRHLLNSGSYPAYKAQTWIYTQGIGHIQGYTSNYAYILGRRWSYSTRGRKFFGINCLDKLGVIDYQGVDSDIPQRTRDAIEWLKKLRKEGKKWTVYPPSREELYPNMCVESGKWNDDKKKIADRLGDITEVWYCGIKHRQNALKLGINSWRDPRCTSETIGMGGVRASTVDKIMDINRQESDKIRPAKIVSRLFDWDMEDNEMFVDFETLADVFSPLDQLPSQPKTDNLFMIGVYYQGEYKSFIANSISPLEEFRIMDEFVKFVRENGNPKLWFWHAESMLWNRAEERQLNWMISLGNMKHAERIVTDWNIDLQFADLSQLFRGEPIVIKGCFKFGLKEIAKAMKKHGMITCALESKCESGLAAAVRAWNVYQTSSNPAEDPVLVDIAKYNKFDVQVLSEILTYLRLNNL